MLFTSIAPCARCERVAPGHVHKFAGYLFNENHVALAAPVCFDLGTYALTFSAWRDGIAYTVELHENKPGSHSRALWHVPGSRRVRNGDEFSVLVPSVAIEHLYKLAGVRP